MKMRVELFEADLITIHRNLRQMNAVIVRCIPKRIGQVDCHVVMYIPPWK